MKNWRRLLFLVITAATANSAAQTNRSDTDIIRFGIPRATLVIIGTSQETYSGGGGSTSFVNVGKVLKAPQGFRASKQLSIGWISREKEKRPDAGVFSFNTNSYIFFLGPAATNAHEIGFNDITERTDRFVAANEANLRFLRSQLP
jgi:hypothetical protein